MENKGSENIPNVDQERMEKRREASQWAVAWRRFKRNKAGLAGLFISTLLRFHRPNQLVASSISSEELPDPL